MPFVQRKVMVLPRDSAASRDLYGECSDGWGLAALRSAHE